MSTEEKNQDPETISENPVNVLFNTSSIAKKDVWEIDIVGILEMLLRILGKSGKKDLRVAAIDDVLKRTFTGFSEIVSGSWFFSSVLI